MPNSRRTTSSVHDGRGSEEVTVAEVMRRDVRCVPADLPLARLAELLVGGDLGRAPVVDGRGRVIGMVALSDLARAAWDPDHRRAAVVADVMMPIAFTLTETATLARAAALMAYEGIGRVIVRDGHGGVAGVVTSTDVLRWLARRAGYLVDARIGLVDEPRAERSVLVVDDDADIREQLAEILADEGYEVITAANGREALDHLHHGRRPALILLDLFMPVMDGWALHEELKKDPRLGDVPVVLLSGQGNAREEARRLDASACLVKPVPYPTLLGTVQKFVA